MDLNHIRDSLLAARRPSLTPSISEFPQFDGGSSRRRSSHQDENIPLSSEWAGSVPSLLKARRPSVAPSTPETYQRARKPRVEPEGSPEVKATTGAGGGGLPESPEEGKGFRASWQIDVKDLVGDAVGNMSISPTSRDIVLAARRGLFIIDLESPLRIPRFLPQGGTWDVADVQWNPHPSHAQYIVSTSSEKLLIWNLRLGYKTSIEHILQSHYRAITDINWHTTEGDVVVSIGIDSWIWAWDLRKPQKPIFGLAAFKSGGTQVKWNYHDPNILASSNSNEVLIWDRRKGSVPTARIQAHSSKIYGIDWSRRTRNEIVTCSLDKSIKVWDINETYSQVAPEPLACICTNYPVWRARNLPFGDGILSLPQRGETTLEMYAKSNTQSTVETFEGHSDVVKEFVWRRGKNDDFQLITWSKDRTLRLWPIDAEVMHKVGHTPEITRGRSNVSRLIEFENPDTFSTVPERQEHIPALSAPTGHRTILAEVKAPQPPRGIPGQYYYGSRSGPPTPMTADNKEEDGSTPTLTSSRPIPMLGGKFRGGTMSKGGAGAKSVAQVDQLAWLASVKVGNKRGSSSGGTASEAPSSRSRPRSDPDRSVSKVGGRQRSGSLVRISDERREGEANQTLQDEITSVLTKLAASKIKLEKHDLSKKRTCTLGLQGPWGERSSVFIRVTFTFPREYPQGTHPHGTPIVELERNPLISMRDRAYMLKHLRRIRERKRPCLEACLRFLLYAREDSNDRFIDSESSSDEDGSSHKKDKELTASLLRNDKNLAEPRTSQGAFGPNGEFVCFFRAPPRIVRNVLRGLTESIGTEDIPPTQTQTQEPQQPIQQLPPPPTSYFQSPSLVSDAVRRLGLAAMDRVVPAIDPRHPDTDTNILRAMTNLLTLPHHKPRRGSDSKPGEDEQKNYAYLPTRRSVVFLIMTTNISGADKKVAVDYTFTDSSLAALCDKNAVFARDHGRYDHERIFRTLRTLFHEPTMGDEDSKEGGTAFASDALAAQIITRIYNELVKEKDLQMLAMVGMLVLQNEHGTLLPPSLSRKKSISIIPIPNVPIRAGGMDYFSLTKSINPTSPTNATWPRFMSPPPPMLAPSLSSSNSSRGSWSSLFNTGSMRQFMNGVQDTLKEGLTTPSEIPSVIAPEIHVAMSRSAEKVPQGLDSPGPRRRRVRKDSSLYAPSFASRSWNDEAMHPSRTLALPFPSMSHRRPILRFADSNPFIHEKHSIVFEPPVYEERTESLFDPQLLQQFHLNVYVYAELLFRWQFFQKRLELLKAVTNQETTPESEKHRIGLLRLCMRKDCRMPMPDKVNTCKHCGSSCSMPTCTICRLPVKGLSRTCLTCSHVTHISCWNSLDVTVPLCPSGCGCFCTGSDGPFTRPSTRVGLTPPTSTLLLASEIL